MRNIIELSHCYSLQGNWQAEAAKKMDSTLIADKITVLSNNYVQGTSYFTQVTKGMSIVLLDAVFTKEVILKRLISDDDLYILQFDLSEKINTVTVVNEKKNIENSKFKSGFSVLHTSIENTFKPKLNQRTFALRLLVDKQTILNYLPEKDKKNKNIERKLLFYNHVNSNSKVLINSLKEKHVFDPDFDSYLRGVSLKLFANFIDTFTNPKKGEISKINIDLIEVTKQYLLDNLYGTFPSLVFLSQMANMSTTKFKVLFKKINNITPNQFFIQQKLILAHKLLQSGSFYSIKEISELLHYPKLTYFTLKYSAYFKRKPSSDFKKKNTNSI